MTFAHFYDPYDPDHPTEHPGLFHVGTWPDSGRDTFARRRAGLTPETPTREVEKGGK